MIIDLKDEEFLSACKSKTPLEMVWELTNGNVRGLEMLALRSLRQRQKLPAPVVNILIAYFYQTYAGVVYDRNDLARLYDHWSSRQVGTVEEALRMAEEDITKLMVQIKGR
ncbi:hypothetical protein V1498_15905 [Peribacillus sp. SCS-26]|uniref:hypothetical protein n=1 Tax=Paraperibacillus marinus TaxID=3115295 RepID=UPI0039061810